MELKELTEQLTQLVTDQKNFHAKAEEDRKQYGEVLTETKQGLENITKKVDELQTQVDAVDLKINKSRFTGDESEVKSPGQKFVESEDFKAAVEAKFHIKKPITSYVDDPFAGRKSTITTTGGITQGTSGVTMPMRLPGITGLAQQALRIRDLMTVRPMTSGNAFDFVQMLTRTNAASPQVETSPKAESTYAWNTVSDTVKTIAHFTNVSRQAIEDVPWLQGVLNSELLYGLLLKEESEILNGDGLGQHLNGLIKQATAYNQPVVSADTKLDLLRHAKLQARLAGLATFAPDGIVVNPTDMATIELIKDEAGGTNKGRYIIGDPRTGTQVTLLWGLPVVESDSMAAGKFLIGAFGTAAELIDRMSAMIEISWEHASNFTANLATILCEERIGLAVRRPGAFIYGSY